MKFNVKQRTAIDNSLRQVLPSIYTGGASQMLQDIWDAIDAGNVGINAASADVDALAMDGGHFPQDEDNTLGLDFAYGAGRVWNGLAIVPVVAGTKTCVASTTNYIECSRAGVVSVNQTGFTAGSVPLYQVTTDGTGITAVVNKKSLLSCYPSTGVPGSMLSTTGATKQLQAALADVSATADVVEFIAPFTGSLSGLFLSVNTTVAGSDTNYWTISVVNKGPAGSGSTPMLATTDANTTKATAPGAGLTAYVTRSFTLHGTPANLAVTKGDVIAVTLTKTAAASNLVKPKIAADFTHTA